MEEMTTNQLELQPNDSYPVVVTVSEATRILRVSRWMFYQLVRAKKLGTITIGRRRLVTSEAIQDFLNRRKAEELV